MRWARAHLGPHRRHSVGNAQIRRGGLHRGRGVGRAQPPLREPRARLQGGHTRSGCPAAASARGRGLPGGRRHPAAPPPALNASHTARAAGGNGGARWQGRTSWRAALCRREEESEAKAEQDRGREHGSRAAGARRAVGRPGTAVRAAGRGHAWERLRLDAERTAAGGCGLMAERGGCVRASQPREGGWVGSEWRRGAGKSKAKNLECRYQRKGSIFKIKDWCE